MGRLELNLPAVVAAAIDMSALQQQVADAQAKADAADSRSRSAMSKADGATTAASTAASTASTAASTASSAQTQAATTASGLVTLQQLADQLGKAIPAADVVHADLHAADTAQVVRIAALEAIVTALQARALVQVSKTVTSTAAIALGATLDVVCTWDTAMPDANYVLVATLDASGITTGVSGPYLKAKTAAAATVQVRATVAVLAGVKVRFDAYRLT